MKLYLQSVCQIALLVLFCVMVTVRESDSAYVPGRCLCPETQRGVRGQLAELMVVPKNPSCNKITVIVTLKSNNQLVCLNPDQPMGKQLIRCWNRANKLGRDVKTCLRRRRRGNGKRSQGHSRKAVSSNSQ